nr:carboxypeptidase y like [Quercus suber]
MSRAGNLTWCHSNVSNMLFIDQPAQTGFSYSEAVNGYIDPNFGAFVQLSSPQCPDYAQASGTCGTYSNGNVSETINSTANGAPQFWNGLQGAGNHANSVMGRVR